MVRLRYALALCCVVLMSVGALARSIPAAAAGSTIGFETPALVDPIQTAGEPDIGVDPLGRVFSSGPTGTGTQRSVWFGSVDGGHTFRDISPGPPPSPLASIVDPPGGGDTDIAFDRVANQYFTDLYGLVCLRSANTRDGGATVNQSVYPSGCSGIPGADRQWLAVYDPPGATTSPYTGPRPLIYQEYNNLTCGAQWVKSNATSDPSPGPGLNYVNGETGGPGQVTGYCPFGADGYPSIDQGTGNVFQAEYGNTTNGVSSILLNIGTPDATGTLTFLDAPTTTMTTGDPSKLITVATGVPDDSGEAANFVVSSIDAARNLYVAWVGRSATPAKRQVWVSVASAASGWRSFSTPVQVSSAPSAVNVFPWIQAGGTGRADVVWYGTASNVDPSSQNGQAWNVYLSQVVFPTDGTGGVTGAAPSVTQVKVTPHPMHYNDICLAGSACIAQQGNRNLADYFQVKMDRAGAAEIVYDDTSNGLAEPGFTPANIQQVDHAGAPVITVARQSSGPGLLGTAVSGPSSAPVSTLSDPSGDALYPVIKGTNVPGMDILGSSMSLAGGTLTVTTRVVDLSNPAATETQLTTQGAAASNFLQYITRWQIGNTIYYAGMENTAANKPMYYAGAAQSIDLCSVSACFPHVVTYPEAGTKAASETGSVSCPATPSVTTPCTLTISVKSADVGTPSASSLLEEVGSYAFVDSEAQSALTNAQAQNDMGLPLQIDGACCYNFNASAPTVARVTRFTARHAGPALIFRWRIPVSSGVAGFNLYAGRHRLNARIIPAHHGVAYRYQVHWTGAAPLGPFRLHVLYRDGHQTVVPAR